MKKKLIIVGLFLLVLSLSSIAVYAIPPEDISVPGDGGVHSHSFTYDHWTVDVGYDICYCSKVPGIHANYWKEVCDVEKCACGYYTTYNHRLIYLGCSSQ